MTAPEVDRLIHSRRWILERPLDHFILVYRRYVSEHNGWEPRLVRLNPKLLRDLLATPMGTGIVYTIFGIPIAIEPTVGGFLLS